MILYHYTKIAYLEKDGTILKEGLRPLDEPKDCIVPPYCGAVWFTTSADYLWANGRIPECRVTCAIPSGDECLVLWKKWLQENLRADEAARIVSLARETPAPWCYLWESYYVYFGDVPLDYIRAIDARLYQSPELTLSPILYDSDGDAYDSDDP
jgi:hypothetical protein